MIKRLSRTLAVMIALTMIVGAFAVLPYSASSEAAVRESVADPIGMDIGPSIRAQTFDASEIAASAALRGIELGEATMADNYEVNDTNWYYTWGYGASNWMEFTKRAEGNYSEVWVANNLSFPWGDSRNDQRINITDPMCQDMVDEFDGNIYPTETEYFSEAPPLNGTNAAMPQITGDPADYYNTTDDGKVMIMVFNIVDESYVNSSYPYYVAGFYTGSTPYYYDRNIINIDCWDWANRTGLQDEGIPKHYSYLYEATIAHEYQHLLHDYVDSGEDTWINEGCSMYAEGLCGYGYSYSDLAAFFYTPDNSLTEWGDQGDINILADYGAALLFMIYLNDHYGGSDIISTIMQNPLHGQEGITDSLWSLGFNRMTFDRVFREWRLANLLWSEGLDHQVGGGLYSYDSISLSEIESELKVMLWDGDLQWGSDFGTTWTIEDYNTNMSLLGAYGTDYLHLNFGYIYNSLTLGDSQTLVPPTYIPDLDPKMVKMNFDGDDSAIIGWELVPLMEDGPAWYSNTGDEIDYLLTMDVDLTVPAAEEGDYLHWLNISTMWEMEDSWDFGFVQVSTDGGLTWTSLNDTGDWFTEEHDSDAMQSIVDNLPGLTSLNDTWTDMSFDLSAYDGQEIMVGFRYMTDWATHYEGWLINGVSVDGAEVDLEDLYPVYPEVDFIVTIFVPEYGDSAAMIIDIPTQDLDETVTKLMTSLMFFYDEMYILISPNEGPVDYWIDVESLYL